jgi:O-antigen/teichoic acid export membrane protein
MSLVFRDAFWQIFGRVVSALAGFIVIKLITPYLGPLRYGDYSTILKYFAIWSALADFGIYVIALNIL